MKKLSLLLAAIMLIGCIALPSFAEETVIKESASGFFYIEAEGDRPRLSAASADKFIQADDEWFKDMNGNGAVDPYEDWRLPVAERVNDLLTRMSIAQKTGTLAFGGIGGKNGITVTDFSADNLSTGQTGVAFIQPGSEQMTSHEPYISVDNVTYAPVAYQVQDMHETTMIAAMTGTPKDQLDVLNAIQKIAEDTELGIPVVFSGDRTYNTWGGMIDAAHYALGVAADEELLYNLLSEYAKESVAIGYHQVFHGYGNEIGSWYGDDPANIAKMSATETRAYEDNGFNSHSKHFIARGGRNAYVAAKSPADLIDSWKIGWKAVVDAGTQWIMTNNNVGITPGLQGYMDKDTYAILRDELGYEGIVCLDWPLGANRVMSLTGVTNDGIDVSTLTLGERYTLILNVGVDMFSCYGTCVGTELNDADDAIGNCYHPQALAAEIEAGKYTEAELDVHVARVLKNKFDLGIFENPYRDWEEALEVLGAAAAASVDTIPMSTADIDAIRRPEIKAMEEELMVKSTVMLKNDGILPLKADAKVFVGSNNSNILEADKAALAARATVVENVAEADVAILHVTSFNDAYDVLVEDAQDYNKPIVLIFEGTVGRNGAQAEPYAAQVKDAAAVLMQTYNNTPDHGSSVGSFYRYTTASVTTEMLYGDKDPAGKLVFEVPVEAQDLRVSWGELQYDIGVDAKTRLYMAMTVKEDPAAALPTNLGNALFTAGYGMSYAKAADIELSLLTVPQEAISVTTETNGRTRTTVTVQNKEQAAGQPFEINFVAKNHGGDGLTAVQVLDGETVIAEKIVAVTEGQFRVVSLEIALEAGEHTITVGNMSTTITVK